MLFFTTTFLTLNHLYSIFASDSPIVSNGIATDQSLNLTHALARCVVVPPDQQCDQVDDWLERRCLTDEHGYGGWVDKCMDDGGYAYEKVDSCPIAWYAGTHGLFRTLWLQTIMGELSTVDLATNAVLVRVVLIRTVRYEHSQGFIFRVMSFFPISYRRLTRYIFN